MPRKYLCKGNRTLRCYFIKDLGWHFEVWRVLSPSMRKFWLTLVAFQNGVTTQTRFRFSVEPRLSEDYQDLQRRYTYSIHRFTKAIASTANVMKVATLVRILRCRYLPCHLAVFPNWRERSSDSRPEAKSDSSSSGTAAILCLQRKSLADMRFSHQRVCSSPNESKTRICCQL